MENKDAGSDLRRQQLEKIQEIIGKRTPPPRGAIPGNGGDATEAILRGGNEQVEQGPTSEQVEAARRAAEMREMILTAQDRAIMGTVLIDIFERFGPSMTNTEKLVMLSEIKRYNPLYAKSIEAAMQRDQSTTPP